MMREAAIASGVYGREIGMFRDFFDVLRELRGDLPIPLDVAAFYYGHTETEANTCIFMEDLKDLGFRVTDKTQGCDYNHARIAIRSLAHYHALTMAALQKWTVISPTTGEREINYPDRVRFLGEKTPFDTADPTIMIKDWLVNYIEFTREIHRPDVRPATFPILIYASYLNFFFTLICF